MSAPLAIGFLRRFEPMTQLHQLSATDSAMLFVETPSTPNHIAPLFICDPSTLPGGGKLRLRQIRAKMEQALEGAPNFRRKLVRAPLDIDEPYWVDDPHFDLDFHLRHIALPEPGDWRQLAIQFARLLSRPLDNSRPMWEMYVIEGLGRIDDLPPGAFAVMLKIHHSMIDGMGALALLNGMYEFEPKLPPEPASGKWQPEPGPNITEMLTRGYWHALSRPGRLAMRVGSLLPGAARERLSARGEDAAIMAGLVAPKTPFNGQITPARVFDWWRHPLAEIKNLRGLAPGSTVNDVALAIVTGAMRRYLLAKGALPQGNLISLVPISIRSEATRDTPAGNEISLVNLPMPTTVVDPVERLRLISAQMAQMKNTDRALSARAIADLTSSVPGTLAGLAARAMTAIGDRSGRAFTANTFVTNVPGMTVPMYFCGARIVNIGGGGPCMNNMGLVHLVGSYCDWFNISIVGCRDLLPDIDFYIRCLDESAAEYLALHAEQPPSGEAPAASKRRRPSTPRAASGRSVQTARAAGGRSVRTPPAGAD
jgi:WS/DGAT/MGAT family acyltransferase